MTEPESKPVRRARKPKVVDESAPSAPPKPVRRRAPKKEDVVVPTESGNELSPVEEEAVEHLQPVELDRSVSTFSTSGLKKSDKESINSQLKQIKLLEAQIRRQKKAGENTDELSKILKMRKSTIKKNAKDILAVYGKKLTGRTKACDLLDMVDAL